MGRRRRDPRAPEGDEALEAASRMVMRELCVPACDPLPPELEQRLRAAYDRATATYAPATAHLADLVADLEAGVLPQAGAIAERALASWLSRHPTTERTTT